MNYFRQLITVTLWEYKRFYKLKNELIGLLVMLVLFTAGFYGGKYAFSGSDARPEIYVIDAQPQLLEILSASFEVTPVAENEKEHYLQTIEQEMKGSLLVASHDEFVLHAWKKPAKLNRFQNVLDAYKKQKQLEEKGLSAHDFEEITQPATLQTRYFYEPARGKRPVVAFFFAGFMVMAVFMSFAYQFTAITGEKQLKITEQIVSAIKPQVWMDGKILGITLTGLSSMVFYSLLSIIGGMLFFMFTGSPVSMISGYLHLPSLLVYFVFTLMGILMWNALMAAVASVITDPNNSGKGSLMMLPVLFVVLSLLVVSDPDAPIAVLLSWLPITSATAMPIRWISTDLPWWNVAGSFILLCLSFYYLRKLAAKIFRVSILISGKEPGWGEVFRLMRES